MKAFRRYSPSYYGDLDAILMKLIHIGNQARIDRNNWAIQGMTRAFMIMLMESIRRPISLLY